MLASRLIAVRVVNKLRSVVIMAFVSGLILAGCAAPAGAPSAAPAGGSVPIDQNVQLDVESDNNASTYMVVDDTTTLDLALAESAYMLVPAPDSLNAKLRELDRTKADNIGVLVPYEVAVAQGLNGSIVVRSSSIEFQDHPVTLSFDDSFLAERDDTSLLLEFEVGDLMTDTAPANVTVGVIGSFSSTGSLPDLGTISAFSPTILGEWDDFCAEHPIDCRGAGGDNLGVCCRRWSWEQWKNICVPCPVGP